MGEGFKSFYQNVLNERLSELLPAQLREKYEPVSCLSGGESSEVYLVRRRSDGQKAVLRVAMSGAGSGAQIERQILDRLNHPAIPKALDALTEDGREYLVREYMEGQTLGAYVKAHGPLQETEIMDIAVGLCDVLSYIHTRQPPIIHRDIKPENIVIDLDGCVKLIDFGIARTWREQAQSDTVAIGSRPYMAPEQFGGAQTDARTDLFSLGVVMIFMATQDPDRTNLPYRFSRGKLLPVVQKCVKVDPAMRYQSAVQLKKAIQRIRRRTLTRILIAAGSAVAVTLLMAVALRLGDEGGFARGYAAGYQAGVEYGQAEGEKRGFDTGYNQRLDELIQARVQGMDDNAVRFFSGVTYQGNTSGNQINDGLAVEAGDYICYAAATQIYRMSPDGKRESLVCNHEGRALNYHNGYLYHLGERGWVYRASVDGSECVPILKHHIDDLLVDGDKLYVANSEDGRKLYRCNLDGSGFEKVSDADDMFYPSISNGYLYFSHLSGKDRYLARLSLDALDSEPEKLDNPEANWINVVGDNVFYAAHNVAPETGFTTSGIMRLNVNGTQRARVIGDMLSYMNVTRYGIFAFSGPDKGRLHKISLDGSKDDLLVDAKVGCVNVAGGWVFYINRDDKDALYRVRVDGTENQRLG